MGVGLRSRRGTGVVKLPRELSAPKRNFLTLRTLTFPFWNVWRTPTEIDVLALSKNKAINFEN
jgi:hypothetical protein